MVNARYLQEKLDKREERAINVANQLAGNTYNKTNAMTEWLTSDNVMKFNKLLVNRAFENMLGSRYKNYNSVEDCAKDLIGYFNTCFQCGLSPTIASLCTWVNLNKTTLFKLAKDPNCPYSEVLQTAIKLCHNTLETGAIHGVVPPSVFTTLASAYYDVRPETTINIQQSNDDHTAETMRVISEQLAEEQGITPALPTDYTKNTTMRKEVI